MSTRTYKFNGEIEELVTEPDIIGEIKFARLARASGKNGRGSNCQRSAFGATTGRRPMGRPRCIWKNGVTNDLQILNVPNSRNWYKKDRKKWGILSSNVAEPASKYEY